MRKILSLSVVPIAGSLLLAACSSSSNSGTSRTTPRAAGTTSFAVSPTSEAASTPDSGLAGRACTKLKTLRDLDYAFGKSFTAIQPLAASSKQQTVSDVQEFQSSAPSELTSSVATLLAFWQKFAADAYSVDDAGYKTASQPFNDYMTAHCS
jgi:hypothetical protein